MSIDSWRGVYAELALGWSRHGTRVFTGNPEEIKYCEPMTLETFIKMLKECVGKTYEGYKGGSYKMDLGTEVWVDNWGECTNTAIVDIEQAGDYHTHLITKRQE